ESHESPRRFQKDLFSAPRPNGAQWGRKTTGQEPVKMSDQNSGVYFVQAGREGPIKIGTAKDSRERLKKLRTANWEYLTQLVVIPVVDHERLDWERGFHARFRHLHIRGEWFKPG